MVAKLSAQKSETKREFVRRKYIHIEPLGPLEDFLKSDTKDTESPQTKKRKVEERHIRKELFKPPEKKPLKRLSYYRTRQSLVSKNLSANKTQSNSVTKVMLNCV